MEHMCEVPLRDIRVIKAAIEDSIVNIHELLQVHLMALGTTTDKNKRTADGYREQLVTAAVIETGLRAIVDKATKEI